MNPPPHGHRLRRVLAFTIPPLVLVLLAWLGRQATSAAASNGPPVVEAGVSGADAAFAHEGAPAASTSGLPSIPAADGATEIGAETAPRPPVELLPDGGVIVDLNLASEDDLRRLPGVGPTRAKAILELRARLGRFKSVDDLARIKGFGRATLRRLRPMVRTSP